MSIIMPAGNKKMEWSPKDETVVKTASVGSEVKEEGNALYEAALSVTAGKKCEKCGGKLCAECGKDPGKSFFILVSFSDQTRKNKN